MPNDGGIASLLPCEKKLNKLRSISYKFRAIINHPSHSKLKRDSNSYSNAIMQAKRAYWEDFLENISAPDIWTANNFIKNPPGDSGQPWIPSLKSTNDTGASTYIDDNASKALLLAKTFFLPPPPLPPQDPTHQLDDHPDPLPDPLPITADQIKSHIANIPSFKAHGPYGSNLPSPTHSDQTRSDLIRMWSESD